MIFTYCLPLCCLVCWHTGMLTYTLKDTKLYTSSIFCIHVALLLGLGPVVIQWMSVNKTNHAIRWIVIYPVDSVIHPLKNPSLAFCAGCKFDVMGTYKHLFCLTYRTQI